MLCGSLVQAYIEIKSLHQLLSAKAEQQKQMEAQLMLDITSEAAGLKSLMERVKAAQKLAKSLEDRSQRVLRLASLARNPLSAEQRRIKTELGEYLTL